MRSIWIKVSKKTHLKLTCSHSLSLLSLSPRFFLILQMSLSTLSIIENFLSKLQNALTSLSPSLSFTLRTFSHPQAPLSSSFSISQPQNLSITLYRIRSPALQVLHCSSQKKSPQENDIRPKISSTNMSQNAPPSLPTSLLSPTLLFAATKTPPPK